MIGGLIYLGVIFGVWVWLFRRDMRKRVDNDPEVCLDIDMPQGEAQTKD